MGIRAYIALAVLLAFMGLGGVALYYRAEAADAAASAASPLLRSAYALVHTTSCS